MLFANIGLKKCMAVILGIVFCLNGGCRIDFSSDNGAGDSGIVEDSDITEDSGVNEDSGVTEDSDVANRGGLGEPCYPDDTCDYGLVCDKDVCESYCGDGIIAGDEKCDNGAYNGVECTPVLGTVCEYCTEDCRLAYKSDYPFIVVYRADTPPNIDGETSEFCRADSIAIEIAETGTQGTYRFLWDNTAIYIAADVLDDELNAVATERNGPVWGDDSIETFFDTLLNGGGSLRFDDYKFFVSILNVHRDSRGGGGWDMDPDYPSAVVLDGIVNDGQKDIGYSLEFALPWSDWLGYLPTAGSTIGFDVVMNDRRNDDSRSRNAWANPGPEWNVPDNWGRMYFSSTTVQTDCNDCVE